MVDDAYKAIPYMALIIAISGVIIGAGAISLGSFGDSLDQCLNVSYTYNNSLKACTNLTPALSSGGEGSRNLSTEMFAVVSASDAQVEIASQLPTVAIIGIMVIIIAIIAGVFVYLRYFA